MNTSMISASVTMGQLQRKMDTISHNLANSNTTGFKRREATFSDLLFQQVHTQPNAQNEVGRLTPNGIRVGSGAKIAETALRLEQGPFINTDRELDFAITDKNHFFRIQTMENGNPVERLSRDGTFYFSENPGNPNQLTIVTSNGDFVLDQNGDRITLPLNFQSISLNEEGQLLVTLTDGTVENIGEFGLTRVLKPQLLDSIGDQLYRLPNFAALGLAAGDVLEAAAVNGRVSQGTLEGSNVDLGNEMNELMMAQRHYQFNSRAISMADDMAGLVNGLRR
ncbi:flagellar hook-basal body protein [Halalkalibacter krulwichiae]|uniref:Flagellar basal-body rod protein FlgG n=2 Tax=Halalkalibacter krulwichiae TaxID=199441 RepID=A0A1X9MH12_9BACI|nr:flagellar hook-basal body protein [Halalkalibacter krulwichiae]ARK32726.1 Flagellar basal-body rod protein FlgG [Halalkalibacter krulwichiae]